MKFIDVSTGPRRIIGIAADIDDENIVPGPAMVVYHPLDQEIGGGRLFVHAQTRIRTRWCRRSREIIRDLSAGSAGRAARRRSTTCAAEVLAPANLAERDGVRLDLPPAWR